MNDHDLPKDKKVRIVKLSYDSESALLEGSDDRFVEANNEGQFKAVLERDKIRWTAAPCEQSEIAWFESQCSNTTLYWTTTALLPKLLVDVGDYGILDDVLYLSYDFRNRVLSCSWNPAVIETSMEIFQQAQREASQPHTQRSMFFDRFHELPTVPQAAKTKYLEELESSDGQLQERESPEL